jgi:hypothetical protein
VHADSLAKIGLAAGAELAASALWRVERNHVIAHRHAGDPGAHFLHYSTAFVAENGREKSLRVLAGQGEGIGVAHPGRDDAHQDFSRPWRRYIDGLDGQRLTGFPGHGGA